tara:strand:+ start:152 stop:610 length:459 start_codon:yes stop_codon:yes gene_type:complete
MATVSYKEGPFDASSGFGNTSPGSSSMPPGVKAAMIDCSVQNMGAGDILEAITIPADSIIVEVGISILVAEGGTATADVGFTGDGPDGFLDGVDLNAAVGITYNSLNAATGADTYSGGRYQAAEDTIDVKFVNAMDAGKYVVWCKFFKTNLN